MNSKIILPTSHDNERRKKGTYGQALGLIKTDVYYTDEMVKQIIWEEKGIFSILRGDYN